MKLDKISNIVSMASLLLFLIFLYKFGFTELFLGSQNVNVTQDVNVTQEEMMKTIRFFSGLFLGLGCTILTKALFERNQPNDFNYVEAKIHRIFDKNFSFEIRSSYERLRTIEYEILDYEFNAYIDIAIEISKIKQEFFNRLYPVAYSIIAIIIASNALLQLVNANPNFSSGFIIGLSFFVFILIHKILDNFKKWKTMYSDLMLLKSNRQK